MVLVGSGLWVLDLPPRVSSERAERLLRSLNSSSSPSLVEYPVLGRAAAVDLARRKIGRPLSVLIAEDIDRFKVGRSSSLLLGFAAEGSVYFRFELHTSRPESRQ